jgi:hypothetical protein
LSLLVAYNCRLDLEFGFVKFIKFEEFFIGLWWVYVIDLEEIKGKE